MRIAQVSPLYESVPPKGYGGTERVVSYLTEELVRLGHEVTLFASADSITQATLEPICPQSLRLDPHCIDRSVHHFLMLERVFADPTRFDIIHFHIDYLHFPLSRRYREPNITTMHGRLDIPDLVPLFQHYPEMPVVSISNAQRRPLPWLNWQGTAYHGLPADLYTLHEQPGQYLAFLGRISPEKGAGRAIEIASRVGMPLKIAAKVDAADREYYQTTIRPLLNNPLIEYIGEIGDHEKDEFLGNAYATLFPIDWEEPFGIVMIESLACGTPLIACPRGSVPEVLDDGVTGLLINSQDEGVRAVERIATLDRRQCRRIFEERFSATRMAQDYLLCYQQVLDAALPLIQPSSGVLLERTTFS